MKIILEYFGNDTDHIEKLKRIADALGNYAALASKGEHAAFEAGKICCAPWQSSGGGNYDVFFCTDIDLYLERSITSAPSAFPPTAE